MRGWQALLLALVAGALGLALGSQTLQITALALLAVLVVGAAYRLLLVGDVHSTREVGDAIVPWGDRFAQQITLTNRSRLRIPAIRITDLSTLPAHPHGYVASLRARRSVTWDVEVPCRTRGRYRLGPVEAHMSDPLGLFPVHSQVGAASSVLVLPRWVPLLRCALRLDGLMPGEARGRRGSESPPAAVSVREYVVGDGISAIHWRASARTGQLMTKLFDPEVQTTLWLALDLDGHPAADDEELLVTAAASLGMYALQQANLRVGLVASGGTPVELPAERGKGHQYRLQEVLAEVHGGDAATLDALLARLDRRLGPGQVFVLLTARGPEDWTTWLERLARRAIAARIISVRETPARWPVPAISLPPALGDPDRERALIKALEDGRRGEGMAG